MAQIVTLELYDENRRPIDGKLIMKKELRDRLASASIALSNENRQSDV